MCILYNVCNLLCFLISRQLAEEVLKASPAPEEGDEENISSGFEGMETLAKAIETG